MSVWEYFKELDELLKSVQFTPEELVIAEKVRDFYRGLMNILYNFNFADAFGVNDVNGVVQYHTFEEAVKDFEDWLNYEHERYKRYMEGQNEQR